MVHHGYLGGCPSVLYEFPAKHMDHLNGTAVVVSYFDTWTLLIWCADSCTPFMAGLNRARPFKNMQ